MEEDSVCVMCKTNVRKVIKKIEQQIPAHLQMQHNMYREYLEVVDDLFGTCMVAEDSIPGLFPPYAAELARPYADHATRMWLNGVDIYMTYLKWYSKSRTEIMKQYDEYVHSILDPLANASCTPGARQEPSDRS